MTKSEKYLGQTERLSIPNFRKKLGEIPSRGPFYVINFNDPHRVTLYFDLLKFYNLVRNGLNEEESSLLANGLTFLLIEKEERNKKFNRLLAPVRQSIDIDEYIEEIGNINELIVHINARACSVLEAEKILEESKKLTDSSDFHPSNRLMSQIKKMGRSTFSNDYLTKLLNVMLTEEKNELLEIVFGNKMNLDSYSLVPPKISDIVPLSSKQAKEFQLKLL